MVLGKAVKWLCGHLCRKGSEKAVQGRRKVSAKGRVLTGDGGCVCQAIGSRTGRSGRTSGGRQAISRCVLSELCTGAVLRSVFQAV